MKEKVENPVLKNNLTIEGISNFFASMLSGNQISNNLEIKKLAHINKLEIPDKLKVEGHTEIHDLEVKENFKSKVFSISNDRITFNPEATIKMSDSRLVFKVKDIFEVITFMKYIVNICGSKLEKCNFGNLLKENNELQSKILEIINQAKNINLPEIMPVPVQVPVLGSGLGPESIKDEKKLETKNISISNSNSITNNESKNSKGNLKKRDKSNIILNSYINQTNSIPEVQSNNNSYDSSSINTINNTNFKFKEKTENLSDAEKELNSQFEDYKRKHSGIPIYNDYQSSLNDFDNDNLNSYYYNSFIPNY